jgi:hypothetical protein
MSTLVSEKLTKLINNSGAVIPVDFGGAVARLPNPCRSVQMLVEARTVLGCIHGLHCTTAPGTGYRAG